VRDHRLAYRFFKLIQRYQYSVADVIGVQTPGNLPFLARWARVAGRRLEVLHNWLSDAEDQGAGMQLSSGPLAGKTIFVYAGNMGVAQGMDCMMDLAKKLSHRQDVGFLFVGRGSDAGRIKAWAATNPNVVFHDEVEPWEIAGLPVLARINAGNDLEALIKEWDVGRVCVGDEASQLLPFAEELLANPEERRRMGERGQALAKSMFSSATAVRQIVAGLK
jgi:hypothetical protein